MSCVQVFHASIDKLRCKPTRTRVRVIVIVVVVVVLHNALMGVVR